MENKKVIHNRSIWQELELHLDGSEAIVITGPRRVGKTVTLQHLLIKIESSNKLFLDLENIINRRIFEKDDCDEVVSELAVRGLDFNSKVYLALDEVQFIKNISSVVKYLQDHYDIKFILTGSSSYYLRNQFTESLAGRKILFKMMPLTFSEYLEFSASGLTFSEGSVFSQPESLNVALYGAARDHYERYVNYGGFPSVVLAETIEDKKRILSEIYSSYINYDVQLMSDFKNIKELRDLISLLAVRVGNRINVNELASITGLSRQTINSYIEFLEQTYLIRTIEVESDSQDVKVRKSRRLYFIDSGIASINADLSGGQKFENAVASQIASYGYGVTYFESKDREIDFIVRDGSNAVAIDVKETPTAADLSSLRRRAYGIGIDSSYLVGRHETQRFKGYVWGGELG